jgi:hypothetical protein
MTVAYDTLTAAQKAQIQTLFAAQRFAATKLIEALQAMAAANSESNSSAATLALIDSAEAIPADQSAQGSLSPFATASMPASLSASAKSNLDAIYNAAVGATPLGIWGQLIGPERTLLKPQVG